MHKQIKINRCTYVFIIYYVVSCNVFDYMRMIHVHHSRTPHCTEKTFAQNFSSNDKSAAAVNECIIEKRLHRLASDSLSPSAQLERLRKKKFHDQPKEFSLFSFSCFPISFISLARSMWRVCEREHFKCRLFY